MSGVSARTWVILAFVVVVIIGLLTWAGTAALLWLNAQAPVATEAGKRLAGEAASRVEQAAPGLKERAEQWLPGVKDQLGRWLPGFGEQPPVRDVSGTDIGPVPRYPDLVRSYFARDDQAAEVAYAGRAAFDRVLAHYVQGFATAGYAHEVVSATPEGEQHRFRRGQESTDLSVARHPGGLLEVRLKQTLQQ